MPERPLPTTAYLLLSLLARRDYSAYELAEQGGRGVQKLWPRADRQRYNTPKRLLADGLVTASTESTGRRSRTVYSITDAGRAALREWLGTEVRPASLEFEGMLRVLVADDGSVDDLRRSLTAIRDQAVADRAGFAIQGGRLSQPDGEFADRRHLFALVNGFMIEHYDQVISWAETALDAVASWPDTTSPAYDNEAQIQGFLRPALDLLARERGRRPRRR
ncbi:MAG: PadR family transcriptional regulator [Candidatus Nanopelagicales bacterium]